MGRHFAPITAYSDKRIRSALTAQYRGNLSIVRLTSGAFGIDITSIVGRAHVDGAINAAMASAPASYDHPGPWYLLILASGSLGDSLLLFEHMRRHCLLRSTWRLEVRELWVAQATFTRPKSNLVRALRRHSVLYRLAAKPVHELLELA